MMAETQTLKFAQEYLAAGLSILKVRADGSKAPDGDWKAYQTVPPSQETVRGWFGNGAHCGIGIIGGKVSGGVEVIDFDTEELLQDYRESVESEAPGLIERLVRIRTPRPGRHFYFRCPTVEGNQKLAQRKIPAAKDDDGAFEEDGQYWKVFTLIETRGEGSMAIAPGSPPECHPLKQIYQLLHGTLTEIQQITSAEREILLRHARALNEYVPEIAQQKKAEQQQRQGELRPGDDFNQRGDARELLRNHGWKYLSKGKVGEQWSRPGVNHCSATLFDGKVLHIFSTNAHPFENNKSYQPFSIYALLEHSGDLKKAAKALAKLGYGEQKKKEDEGTAKAEKEAPESVPYRSTPLGLVWLKPTREGSVNVQLTNFTAKVTGEVVKDDGAETRVLIEITAQLSGRTVSTTVTPASYRAMNWPIEAFGASAIIYPNCVDQARCAISLLSGSIPQRPVFAHTGWRKIDDEWCYLHAGGAISAQGTKAASVELDGPLGDYRLPDPPEPAEWAQAMCASLGILEVTDDAVSIPAMGGVWDAVLSGADYSIFVEGASGERKSALTAVFQSSWGAAFAGDHLPANWLSTSNTNSEKQHSLKDALLVVDDYKPSGDHRDRARLERDAERTFRGAANHSGRGRMNADGSLRPEKPPRCLTMASGEDVPPGASLRARLFILHQRKGAMHLDLLSQCQQAAQDGVYAAAMAGYLKWLAPQIQQLQRDAGNEIAKLRDEIGVQLPGHGRTPTTVARLERAWALWLKAALECGAIKPEERADLWKRIISALIEAGKRQADYLRSQDPAQRFCELVTAALTSGRAHLLDATGKQPENAAAYGWRSEEKRTRDGFPETIWNPMGDKIGWIGEKEKGEIYLQPDNAYRLAQQMASDGEKLAVSQQTLWKRLDEAKMLAAKEDGHLTVKRTVEDSRKRVLVLRADFLSESLPSAKAGQPGREHKTETHACL